MEIASETILTGKAKVMVAGGFDDLFEEGSNEFGNMKVTSNSETELAMGREPTEMLQSTTTTHAGGVSSDLSCQICIPKSNDHQFMESQGVGVHILMSAETALELSPHQPIHVHFAGHFRCLGRYTKHCHRPTHANRHTHYPVSSSTLGPQVIATAAATEPSITTSVAPCHYCPASLSLHHASRHVLLAFLCPLVYTS